MSFLVALYVYFLSPLLTLLFYIVFAYVIDIEDSRMSDAARGLGFENETRGHRSLACDLGGQDLERELFVHAEVERAIDGAHPSASQLLVEPILGRENLPDSARLPHHIGISRVRGGGSNARAGA